jgi:hypothetical protein
MAAPFLGFRRHVKWRTGSEGRISYLKRCYGWDRTRLDGYGEPAVERDLQALGVRTIAIPRKAKTSSRPQSHRAPASAAVGGDRAWYPLSGPVDALHRGRELRGVGQRAVFDAVVEDDAIVVVGDLGLYPNSTGSSMRPLRIGRASGPPPAGRTAPPSDTPPRTAGPISR